MNLLNKAFADIEKTVADKVQKAALSVVDVAGLDEFPTPQSANDSKGKLVVTGSSAARARAAFKAWSELDFDGHKAEWELLVRELKGLSQKTADVPDQQWQQRARDAEYKLYQVCSVLLDAPDPAPFIESVSSLSSKIVEVEAANRQLSAAAEAASADAREVGALVDAHHKLEADHKALQEEEARKGEALAAVSGELEEARAAKAAADEAASELARTQAALKALRKEYEAAQSTLFDLSNAAEAASGAKVADAELALEQVEQLQGALAEARSQRDALAVRLAEATAAATAAAGGSGGGGANEGGAGAAASASGGGDAFWEAQLRAREEQAASLTAQLQAMARSLDESSRRHAAEVSSLTTQLSTAQLAAERLRRELDGRPDAAEFSELSRRLEALKAMVDVQMEKEGWELPAPMTTAAGGAAGGGGKGGSSVSEGLEGLDSPACVTAALQERNRRLHAQAGSLRQALEAKTAEAAGLSAEVKRLEGELEARGALVRRLEEDLLSAAGRGAAISSAAGASGLDVAPAAAATAAAVSGVQGDDGAATSSSANGTAAAGGGGGGGGNLLSIVVSQRDRFRQRLDKLEEEKAAVGEELAVAQRKLEEVRGDNVALYEKVRYLERYSQKVAATAGKAVVVKVDESGAALDGSGALLLLEGADEQQAAAGRSSKASRYQCGPLAFEIGLGGGGSSPAPASSSVAGGPLRAAGYTADGMRSRGRRGGGGNGGMAASTMSCFGGGDAGNAADEELGSGPEARAARDYDARTASRVNPFAEFQAAEAEAQLKSLQLPDRAVLAGGRLLMGSRMARIFIVTYAVLLHVFIAILIYVAVSPLVTAPGRVQQLRR